MSNLSDVLVTLGCAVAGAGTAIGLLSSGAPQVMSGIAGVAVFGIASQLQNVAMRRRDRLTLERELIVLKRADLIMSDQLSQTAEQFDDRMARAADGHAEREQRLSSELRLLETLLRQFAESMVRRVQAVEAAQLETAGHARRLQARLSAGAPIYAPPPQAQTSSDDAQLLDMIQRCLIENRMDLHMQPVVILPQRKLRFYEALTRLRTPDGALIMPDQYLRVAEQAGLMSTVDNLLLFRCVQFIRRMAAKNRETGVFCNISMHSLGDSAFFPQFVDFMRAHRDLGSQIIFELPQSAFDAMGPAEDASLKELADLGFSFSMDHVTSLGFDPDRLRRRGVRFVKVSPALLLAPDVETGAGIRPEDFREVLWRQGIALIGEKIETERQVVDLLDFQIDFGQGYLFGEPRPLKDDVPETGRVETIRPEPARAEPQVTAPQPAGMTALFQQRPQRRAAG